MIDSGEEKPVPAKLPPNWKSAVDSEGNIYYYHSVTRQTQWDPPTFDPDDNETNVPSPPDNNGLKKRRHKNKTMSAVADTSLTSKTDFSCEADIPKNVRDKFKAEMSSIVVECLNPYRSLDCEFGRITSVKSFKHIARRLTHFVMDKELKRCRNVEDLGTNESIRRKVKGYVKKYMIKHGTTFDAC